MTDQEKITDLESKALSYQWLITTVIQHLIQSKALDRDAFLKDLQAIETRNPRPHGGNPTLQSMAAFALREYRQKHL